MTTGDSRHAQPKPYPDANQRADGHQPADALQEDALDAYLDALSRGDAPTPPAALDPALVVAARRARDLARAAPTDQPTTADLTRTWERLMPTPAPFVAMPTPSSRQTLPPSRSALAPSAAPTPGPLRDTPTTDQEHGEDADPHRWRRARQRVRTWPKPQFGMVASIALMVLIAVGGFAIFTNAPGRNGDATGRLAAVDSTPRTNADRPPEAEPVSGVAPDGTEYIRVPYAYCDIAPMAYDEVMEIVIGENYPSSLQGIPPRPEIANYTTLNSLYQWHFGRLPPGEAVSEDVVEAVARTYSVYLGCEGTPLYQAPLFSAEGLAKHYYGAPSRYLTDGAPNGSLLSTLWYDSKGLQGNDEDHFGTLSRVYLYDFRLLPNGKIVAFVSSSRSADPGVPPTFYVEAGYVMFVEQDGEWLIDEQFRR